jgi:hypothetical protein
MSPMRPHIRILRSVLPVLSAIAILGILGVSSHVGRPKPPLITVLGPVQGSGTDAAAMAVTFSGLNAKADGSYIANPDGILAAYGR